MNRYLTEPDGDTFQIGDIVVVKDRSGEAEIIGHVPRDGVLLYIVVWWRDAQHGWATGVMTVGREMLELVRRPA